MLRQFNRHGVVSILRTNLLPCIVSRKISFSATLFSKSKPQKENQITEKREETEPDMLELLERLS